MRHHAEFTSLPHIRGTFNRQPNATDFCGVRNLVIVLARTDHNILCPASGAESKIHKIVNCFDKRALPWL
jgi:hypothetical protein